MSKGSRGALLFWALLIAGHLLRIFGLFGSVADLTSDVSIMNGDYPFQAYHAELGLHSLRTCFTDQAYDPFFLAGYPKTPHFCASVVPFEAAGLAIPGTYRAPKAVAVVTPLVWLLAIVVTLRAFGAPPLAVRVGAVLAVCLYWMSLPLLFTIFGMIGFLLGVALATASTGLLFSATNGGPWIPFLLVSALAINIHPHGLLLTFLGCGSVLLFSQNRWKSIPMASGWLILVSIPYLHSLAVTAGNVDTAARNSFWAFSRPFEPFYYYLDLEKDGRQAGAFELLLLLLALRELYRWKGQGESQRPRAIGLYLAALFAITFYGSNIPQLASIQPVRLTAALGYATVIPAAFALSRHWEHNNFRRGLISLCAFVLLVLLSYGYTAYAGVLRVGLTPTEQELVGWLSGNRFEAGRILIEDSFDGGHLGDSTLLSGRIGPLLPLMTHREIIGGPMDPYLKHRYANACDGIGFGRTLSKIDNFEQVLIDYGISGILVWSGSGYRAALGLKHFRKIGRVGRLVCFAGPAATTVRTGRATVTAKWNNLHFEQVQSDHERLIVAYHYDPHLVVDPPARIVPVPWGSDPIPFIEIQHPPERFDIRFCR